MKVRVRVRFSDCIMNRCCSFGDSYLGYGGAEREGEGRDKSGKWKGGGGEREKGEGEGRGKGGKGEQEGEENTHLPSWKVGCFVTL